MRIATLLCFVLTACSTPSVAPVREQVGVGDRETAPVRRASAAAVRMTPARLTLGQTQALHEGVRSSLKDPASAQFGSHVAGNNGKGGIVVCGWVNACNSYGGYTGKQPYLGFYLPDNGTFYAQRIGGTDVDVSALLSVCADMGLALSVT